MQRYRKSHVNIKLGLDYSFEIRRIKGLFVKEMLILKNFKQKRGELQLMQTPLLP